MKTLINFVIFISLKNLAIAQTKENNVNIPILNISDLANSYSTQNSTKFQTQLDINSTEIPKPLKLTNEDYEEIVSSENEKNQPRKIKENGEHSGSSRSPLIKSALQIAARKGLEAMVELYNQTEPNMIKKGQLLDLNHPATLLSQFSAPTEGTESSAKAAFALLVATKNFQKSYKQQVLDLGRQAPAPRITFRRTPLEGLCPSRDPPICLPAAQRYRTHDGTCNNFKRPRWGAAQMPFNRFLPPEYSDGIDSVRASIEGGPLASARFVSLVVHGADDGEAPVTLMLAQWGQLIDHDLTATAQPRSINGSVPRCCGADDTHPSCFPIKVPKDDPWLSPLKVRCLEFLRSAPAQRRDCILSWREQSNQVTSYLDASPIYSSNARTSDSARIFRNGLLLFGRGDPHNDICLHGGISRQCIRAGDARSNEQPGLLALHQVWVVEHNRIAMDLSDLNPHWSDEKIYQEARRIVGAMFQHITYREFLPLVLGKEVCKLFDLELLSAGYYTGYDPHINPTVGNSFAAAAFRFGHSLVQGSYMRCDRNHNFLDNNVTLHEEFTRGDLDNAGSLPRLLRGMAAQKSQMRDEFITPELTNHLFQSGGFPFGLDLAAINIQRGRDHGIPPYTSWREPCGLSPVNSWEDLENVVGPGSAHRISNAYRNVHDIDLFVGGIAERPVIGGLVGPTFACIIAQQFSNLRKGDRFWYENDGFESSFTPAQLHSIRRVSLAQVLCRDIGDGTLQPHIFIPHNTGGNDRLPCGVGPLAPIDLLPWVELEPFLEKHNRPQQTHDTTEIDRNTQNLTFINRIDLANAFTGHKRPLQPNLTKIHDKLDLKQKGPQTDRINNKLDASKRKHLNTKLVNPTKKNGPTKRTVIVNNIPILLRHNSQNTKKRPNVPAVEEARNTEDRQGSNTNKQIKLTYSNRTENTEIKQNATDDSQKPPDIVSETAENTQKNQTKTTDKNRIKRSTPIDDNTETAEPKHYKRETVRDSQKSHEIFIEFSDCTQTNLTNCTNNNKTKINTATDSKTETLRPKHYNQEPAFGTQKSHEIVIETPENAPYEIAINIKHANHKKVTPTNDKINLPFDKYKTGSNTGSTPFNHDLISSIRPERSTDFRKFTKPPTIIFIDEQDDFQRDTRTTTKKPGFPLNHFALSTNDFHSGERNKDVISNNIISNLGSFSTSSSNINKGPNIFNIPVNHHAYDSFAGTISNNADTSSFNVNIRRPPQHQVGTEYTRKGTISSKPSLSTKNPYYFSNQHASPHINTQSPFSSNQNSHYSSSTGFNFHYRSTTTKRPYYQTTNFFRPQYKELDNSNDTPLFRSLLNEYDYNISTYNPITTNDTVQFDDYYNDEDDQFDNFDKDGYLRPEHMQLDILQRDMDFHDNNVKTNGTETIDDFVLPILKDTDSKMSTPTHNNFTINYFDIAPRHSNSDIFSADSNELLKMSSKSLSTNKHSQQSTTKPLVAFAPLNVLTRPERPDKWAIFSPPEDQVPLPEQPELNMNTLVAKEFPKPIKHIFSGIHKRFKPTNKSTISP